MSSFVLDASRRTRPELPPGGSWSGPPAAVSVYRSRLLEEKEMKGAQISRQQKYKLNNFVFAPIFSRVELKYLRLFLGTQKVYFLPKFCSQIC